MKQRKEKLKEQGPNKPAHKTRSTHKQNWARSNNVHSKATANSELGKKIRSMLYQMTKEKKYVEKNFQKNSSRGITYSKMEIRSSLALAKRKALVDTKKHHQRLVKIQKKRGIKKTSLKDFKRANPHLVNPLTGFDTADVEAFYDS